MKAKLTRQKLYEVCHIKARDKKLIDDELTELERLADIGRAAEKALDKGGWIQIPLEHDIDTTDDLLEWEKGGK